MLKICNIVIVGGEGDLAFRKLYPALYSLHKQNLLADCTRVVGFGSCLLYTSPSPRDRQKSRMPSSA